MTEIAARCFYKEAAAVAADGVFRVELDGRPVRSPMGTVLTLPAEALASAVAEEWRNQGDTIVPAAMPMMQLACTAIDRVGPNRQTVIADTAAYGASDLLCYRADAPADLVALQEERWQPVLDWLAATFGARLAVTGGIVHVEQPADSLDALQAAVADFDTYPLTAVVRMTQVFGSLGLALAVAHGRLDHVTALAAAQLDEIYQAEKWGDDREAVERRRNVAAEAAQAARFLGLVGA